MNLSVIKLTLAYLILTGGIKMGKPEIKEKLIQARKLINEACNDADYIENDVLAEDFASLLTNMDGDLEESLRILDEDN